MILSPVCKSHAINIIITGNNLFLTEKLHEVLQTMRTPPPHPATNAKSRIQNYYTPPRKIIRPKHIIPTHTRARGWSGSDDYYHNYYIILILDKRVR